MRVRACVCTRTRTRVIVYSLLRCNHGLVTHFSPFFSVSGVTQFVDQDFGPNTGPPGSTVNNCFILISVTPAFVRRTFDRNFSSIMYRDLGTASRRSDYAARCARRDLRCSCTRLTSASRKANMHFNQMRRNKGSRVRSGSKVTSSSLVSVDTL